MVDEGFDVEDFLERAYRRDGKMIELKKRYSTSPSAKPSPIVKNLINNNSEDQTSRMSHNPRNDKQEEITYPPLSPLAEETDVEPSVCPDDEMSYDVENKSEMVTFDDDNQLNYSSDLSIECDNDESDVYRAKLVYADSSPKRTHVEVIPPISNYQTPIKSHQSSSIPFSQISPRKRTHSVPQPSLHDYQQPRQQPSISSQDTISTTSTEPNEPKITTTTTTSSQSLPEVTDIEQSIKALKIKVERAEQNRTQLKKAVECSKYGSKEHIEAARLLQIAEIEHLNYTNYMAMFKQGLRKKTDSLGSIKISSIRLKVSNKLRNDLAEDSVFHYFFCIASCGTEVKATHIMDTNDIKCQDLKAYIQFKDKITFAQLQPDFTVKVEVFELIISQPLPKLLLRLTPSKKSKITRESHFRRVGSMKLTLSDRDVKYKNLVQWSKLEESKYLERECKFEMELRPEQLPSKSGKLDIRSLNRSGCLRWDRFWVECSQAQIRFWKSQQDAEEGKKPNDILMLQDLCCQTALRLTPDDDLYRQNSFLIFTIQQVAGGEMSNLLQKVFEHQPTSKIVRHQFAAGSKEESLDWIAVINKSISCYREWHGTNPKIYTFEQIEEMFY